MLDQSLVKFFEVTTRAIEEPINTDSLANKLNQLMPSIYIMVATLGALCILIIILTKFFYKPVKKMIKNRQDFIQKNIDESISAKKQAFDYEQQAKEKLEESKNIASDIISKSKIEAEIIKHQYLDQGKLEASRIIEEAKQDITSRQRKLEDEVYKEIVSVAIDISQKIIKDKVSEKEAKKYLDEYLGNNHD